MSLPDVCTLPVEETLSGVVFGYFECVNSCSISLPSADNCESISSNAASFDSIAID